MTTSWEKEGPRAVRPEPLPEDCLELVLNKEAAGYAFLFARVALHTDVNGERQVIRGREPEAISPRPESPRIFGESIS